MRLLTVGSSPQSNIILSSPYVSSYHADIIILDNGDVLISDKGSTNGTFLNGARLSPNVEVAVRRTDRITFADMDLDWSRIPQYSIDSNVKRLISIGSHPRNQIRISSQKASRFHATIKQDNEGKWYICDHSKNGTLVNNLRIPKDSFVRLKKGDSISCGGIPIENPCGEKKSIWIPLASIAAAIVLLFGCLWVFTKFEREKTGEEVYAEYSNSTVLIYMGYHYMISAGSLNVVNAFGANEFVISGDQLVPFDGNNSQESLATGFYISDDGLIATCLHVAKPWLYDKNLQPVEDLVRVWLNNLSKTANPNYINYISQVQVTGVVDFVYAIPHGSYFDGHTAMSCIEVAASNDTEMDVAILKAMLPSSKLPDGSTYVSLTTIPNRSSYKPGTKIFTIGFPMAKALQDIEKKKLQAIFAEGTMSASNNNYDFGHTAQSTNGASGSPVFDKKGNLIGVISSGYGNGYNFAVRAEYLMNLLEQAKSANNL